jgi:hypothetical protein
MTHDEENLGPLIQAMLEAGIQISEIEAVLGVKIQSRVIIVDYIVEVAFSPICGELEFSMN